MQAHAASGSSGIWCSPVQTTTTAVPAPCTSAVRRLLRFYVLVNYSGNETSYLGLGPVEVDVAERISGSVFCEEYLYLRDGTWVFCYRK